MQPNVPFRLIEVLATSRVGKVWAGVDPVGRQLTVAVLDEGAAVDPGWRAAFESAVRTMTQPHGGPMPVVGADFAAAAPWVAVLADGGPGAARVFQTLGVEWVDYWPVNPPVDPAPPAHGPAQPGPAYGPPADPIAGNQGGAWATRPYQQSDPPVSSPPVSMPPVSSPPVSMPPVSMPSVSMPPVSSPPVSMPPVSSPPSYQPPVSSPPVYQPQQPSVSQLPAFPPPISSPPASGLPGYQSPVSGPPGYQPQVSGPPGPYSPDQPVSAQPSTPWGAPLPPPYSDEPLFPPLGDVSPPRRSRKRMWVVLAVVVVLALAGGATAVALTVRKDGKTPVAEQSAPASSGPVIASPSPRLPGLEPPRVGDWPRWPVFGPANNPQPHALDGTGLTLALPSSWTCTRAATDEGATRYNCGVAATNGDEVGGEITVRTCEKPCNTERRDEMRKAEEAWGQQWRYAGDYAVIAETKTVNGSARYGLVVVAYWRSTPDDAVDRQLVFRMTAPEAWADEIRKVANAAKDAAKF